MYGAGFPKLFQISLNLPSLVASGAFEILFDFIEQRLQPRMARRNSQAEERANGIVQRHRTDPILPRFYAFHLCFDALGERFFKDSASF